MKGLYLLTNMTYSILILCLVLLILIEFYIVIHNFYFLKYIKKAIYIRINDISILFELFMILYFASFNIFQYSEGIILVKDTGYIFPLIFTVMLISALPILIKDRNFMILCPLLASLTTLPFIEERIFLRAPLFIFPVLFLFFIWEITNLIEKIISARNVITAFSLKEAVDHMDFGLLLYSINGNSRGEILLCNNKMEELMYALCGKLFLNGDEFHSSIYNANVLSTCKRLSTDKLAIYTLPCGDSWQFELIALKNTSDHILLYASNITEYTKSISKIYNKNRELKKRNKELKKMLDNLEYICREEAIINIAGKVHDILGHRISLMLRSLREHKKTDIESLKTFSDSLMDELSKTPEQSYFSINTLKNDFERLGVNIFFNGPVIDELYIRRLFFEITFEAASNSVRHGYADEIYIDIEKQSDKYIMKISDNGIIPSGEISEGHGIKNMRRKCLEYGGILKYSLRNNFKMYIEIPTKKEGICSE